MLFNSQMQQHFAAGNLSPPGGAPRTTTGVTARNGRENNDTSLDDHGMKKSSLETLRAKAKEHSAHLTTVATESSPTGTQKTA